MTAPSHRDDATDGPAGAEQDFRPSLRFRILFTATILLIAIGYTWVWRVKTERVEAEPPPVLALRSAASRVAPGAGGAAEGESERLGRELLLQLQQIPRLTVLDARIAMPLEPPVAQTLSAEMRTEGPVYVLELRRMDATSGNELYVYSVTGATFDDAVYRMSVQIAMSFGLPRPTPPAQPSGT